jgi:hypothetical protein
MEQNEFVSLVEDLEAYARQHPTAYKFRVGALAALGYVFLLGTVVGVLMLIGACLFFGAINAVVIKFLIIPIGFAAVVPALVVGRVPKA